MADCVTAALFGVMYQPEGSQQTAYNIQLTGQDT